MNALDLQKDEVIRTFQIDYRHEIKAGSTITMHTQRDEKTITAMGLNEAGDCMFAAKIELV